MWVDNSSPKCTISRRHDFIRSFLTGTCSVEQLELAYSISNKVGLPADNMNLKYKIKYMFVACV